MPSITVNKTNNSNQNNELIRIHQKPSVDFFSAGQIDPITQLGKFKQELLGFAMRRTRSHLVTLNTHANISDMQANQRLERWRVEIMRRLHGRRFFKKPDSDLFEYLGSLEHTLAGHPHFHLVCAIPTDMMERFNRHAQERWQAIVPSGTFHITPITQNPESLPNVVNYVFKHLKLNTQQTFIDSRLAQRTPKHEFQPNIN